jgi:hypothetical protein
MPSNRCPGLYLVQILNSQMSELRAGEQRALLEADKLRVEQNRTREQRDRRNV